MKHMTRNKSAMLGALGLAAVVAAAVSAQSQGPADAPHAVRLAQAATTKKEAPSRPARPLEDPRLRYPTGEFEQKNGAVVLQLLIDEQGGLVRTDVVCAAPPFMTSALESVQELKFQPAVAREGPVKSYMLVEFGYGRGYPCGRIPD